MQKRRGDKGVARVRGVRFVDGTSADVDLIRSDREADESRVFAAMAFVHDDAGDLAVVHSIRRDEWGAPGGWREPGESVRENAVREVARGDRARRRCGRTRAASATNASTSARRGGLWQEGRDLLQVYARCASPAVVPPLTPELDDTSDRRWVTWAELGGLCSGQFWWPLAAADAQPARRVSSRARFSRADRLPRLAGVRRAVDVRRARGTGAAPRSAPGRTSPPARAAYSSRTWGQYSSNRATGADEHPQVGVVHDHPGRVPRRPRTSASWDAVSSTRAATRAVSSASAPSRASCARRQRRALGLVGRRRVDGVDGVVEPGGQRGDPPVLRRPPPPPRTACRRP